MEGRKRGSSLNWWAREWVKTLESFGWDNRLARGKAYARNGNVLEIYIYKGLISAKVQGRCKTPYWIKITLDTLSREEWERVLDALADRAIFTAKLLAGEMPDNIEEVFSTSKLSLFPKSSCDFYMECSCLDLANPCKHIAAVHYTVALEFNRDPFMLFRLRGMEREEIIEALRKRRTVACTNVEREERLVRCEEVHGLQSQEEFTDKFWVGGVKNTKLSIVIEPPSVNESILKRLGDPPFFIGKNDMVRQLKNDYRKILIKALTIGYSE